MIGYHTNRCHASVIWGLNSIDNVIKWNYNGYGDKWNKVILELNKLEILDVNNTGEVVNINLVKMVS